MAQPLVGLKIGAFRPLIPSVDEDESVVGAVLFAASLYRRFEPSLERSRAIIHKYVAMGLAAR